MARDKLLRATGRRGAVWDHNLTGPVRCLVSSRGTQLVVYADN